MAHANCPFVFVHGIAKRHGAYLSCAELSIGAADRKGDFGRFAPGVVA